MDDVVNETLQRAVRMWLERDVRPNVLELEHADTYPRAMVEQMREFGLFGATIPERYGGMGLTVSAYASIVEAISEVWMSLTGVVNTHLMVAELIRRHGTEEQRTTLLPQFASGELRAALGLTEADGGTDLQAIRTVARRDGNRYVIDGTKTWITNGGEGNCIALLVKTDPHAEPRSRGTSLLFVRRSDGYEVVRRLGKLGYKGVDTVELRFDGVSVSVDRLIGDEGRGLASALSALELGRINVAARGVGVANAALVASVAYSRDRHTMGKPIAEHQAIQLKLADMACRVRASRLLVQAAARAYDEGRRCDFDAGIAKLVASEAALDNATEALRIHAAYGYSTEGHVERYFRDAPLLCIGEGTNEIQRIVIARQLAGGATA